MTVKLEMTSKTNKTKVIIIGGGIAGIKSSLELHKHGVSNMVLEARDRLGGRLHTIETGSGLKIDLGASWFHDCLTNPLLKKNWESGKVKFNFDDGKFEFFNENGSISENLKLNSVAKEITAYLKYICSQLNVEDDISVKEAVFSYLNEKKYCLTEDQIKYSGQLVRYFEMWIGSSWEILSARSICTDEHRGRDAMVLNGYTTVFNEELNDLIKYSNSHNQEDLFKKGLVKLEKMVYKIQWDNEKKEIAVFVKDIKTNKVEVFYSEYLICTIPLSVLKLNNSKEIGNIEWNPPLPKSITNSLQKISFSNLGKVFFEFDKLFWSAEPDRMLSLAKEDKKMTDAIINNIENYQFFKGTVDKPIGLNIKPHGEDYTILFMNLYKPTGKPILLALVSSPLTQYLESATKIEIFNVFKPVFARISGLKESEIPIPIDINTSKWSHDPFARGSYTGITVGDDFEPALKALIEAKDIFDGKGRVRFAGEGVIDDGNGCAHAAWVTGMREANNILKLISKCKL